MKTKKILALLSVAALMVSMAACGADATNGNSSADGDAGAGLGAITVVSREDGSGTRGAFIELMGVEVKDADGNKTDMTTEDAIIQSKTDAVMTTVAGDPAAIGYISLGSLNDNIKAVKVDGVDATAENVKNGTYAVSRPFNIATKGEATGVAKDFISFILSAEGQSVVADSYIEIDSAAPAFTSDGSTGKLVIGGSSSVSPLMEKLIAAYQAINADANIELQTSDSSSGMTGTIDGTLDIGMASRELKDSESAALTGTAIALDGIAVIVHNDNPQSELSAEQIMQIYTGALTAWNAL